MRSKLIFLAALLTLSGLASAHTRSLSHSVWELGGDSATLSVRLSQYDLTRLQLHPQLTPDYPQAVAAYLRQHLKLEQSGQTCQYSDAALRPQQDAGWLTVHLQLQCPDRSSQSWRIHSRLFEGVLSAHQHFATVRHQQHSQQRVLHAGQPSWSWQAGGGEATHFAALLKIGLQHILSGWDHLAFVLGLLFLARRPGQLIWLVSGFTLGHSISLAAATLGLVSSNSQLVESLIGLSIALLAMELAWRPHQGLWLPASFAGGLLLLSLTLSGAAQISLWGMALFCLCYFAQQMRSTRPHRWQLALSCAFGLIHGFGFAGLLSELQIEPAQRPLALLGFNLGVELGQILVVILAWLALQALASWRQRIQDLAVASLAGLGSYWLVLRILM